MNKLGTSTSVLSLRRDVPVKHNSQTHFTAENILDATLDTVCLTPTSSSTTSQKCSTDLVSGEAMFAVLLCDMVHYHPGINH